MTFFSIYSFNLTFQNFKIQNLGIKSGHIKSEWQERKPKKRNGGAHFICNVPKST